MKFSLTYARALQGNDINVGVDAENEEQIAIVRVVLDDFTLAEDRCDPGTTSYDRQFLQAGSASPKQEHKLLISVTTEDGKTKGATKIWEDLN